MASAVIRSFQLIALVLATGAVAAQAQTAAPKTWTDPGAVERAKTQSADPAAGTPPADAKPVVDPKQAASDSEKLKELIRASETADAGKAKTAAAKHAHRAHHVAHAHALKKVAAKAVRRPIAYEYLPNKKDGPVPAAGGPISAAY